MNYIADLHNHTNASDGEYTPTELVQKGKDFGLRAIGVTDHDTLSGLDEALAAGERLGNVVVKAEKVSKAYGEKLLFDDLNFDLPRGGIGLAMPADCELAPLAERARQDFFRQEIEMLSTILEEGRESGEFEVKRPRLLAMSVISACIGIERQFLEIEGSPSLNEGLEELLNVLFHGLCREG